METPFRQLQKRVKDLEEISKGHQEQVGFLLTQLSVKEKYLQITKYQRSYSWDHNKATTFVKDLIIDEENNAHKFCGSMIYKTENNGYHIVDGQQRMITSIDKYELDINC